MAAISNEDLEHIFDDGEDITAFMDVSTVRRPNQERVPKRISMDSTIPPQQAGKEVGMNEDQVEFVTYCIGNLSMRLGIPQPEIYKMLSESNILDGYIIPCYGVLHTFGKDYLMNDLIDFMREKGLIA